MSLDIDSVLIDRLFQPASDRLAERVTCFGLARLSLLAAVVLQFVVLAYDLQADADGFRRMLAGATTLLALVGAQQGRHVIARAERQTRPGLLNVRRITMRWQRVAWLIITVWAVSVALGHVNGANIAVCVASVGWASCIYFLSCSPSPPPLRRHASVFALAYAGGAGR